MSNKKNIPFNFDKAAAYLNEEQSEHLSDLLKNEKAFHDCQKTWNILNEMKKIEEFDSNEAWQNLHKRLEKDHLIINKTKPRIKRMQWISLAASFLIVLVVGSIVYLQKQTQIEITENNTGKATELTLSDGSKVWLNKGAGLSYPKDFKSNVREVSLTGEAFFEITPDVSKPFIISVNQAQVKVLGTSFNIKSDNQNNIEVLVKTGKVEFCDCLATGKNIILTPGEAGMLSQGKLKKSSILNDNYLSWINRKLIFKASSMHKVLNDINLAYHTQVNIQDSAIYSMQITATFDNLTIEELLNSVSLTLPITVKQQGKSYILALKQ